MRHEDGGHAGAFPDLQQFVLELLARQRVECAERLVHQQDAGIVGEHAGNCDALLHPARQLVRVAVGEALKADHPDEFVRGPCNLLARQMALPRSEADVLAHGHPGKQRVILEHHAAVAPGAGDRLAGNRNAPGRRLLEAGDDAQERRFSATGRADHADELALWNRQIDRCQRLDLAVTDRKALGHAADGQNVW